MSAVGIIAVTTAGRSLRGIKRPLGTLLLRLGSSTTTTKAEDLQHAVSRTSIGTAMMRAMEQNQPQPLFHDPYAATLAGNEGCSPADQECSQSVRRRLLDVDCGEAGHIAAGDAGHGPRAPQVL